MERNDEVEPVLEGNGQALDHGELSYGVKCLRGPLLFPVTQSTAINLTLQQILLQ